MIATRAILVILGLTLSSINEANSAPQGIPPLITFKDGKIGVNFLGFHAAAGLGGAQNGGGLHAEAGTPFGQKAVAGLGGSLGNDGSAAGRLYAGATAGGNVRAAAGLGGAVVGGDSPRTGGGLFSAASAGRAKAGSALSGGISDDTSYSVVEKTNVRRKVDDDEENVHIESLSVDDDETLRVRGHPVKFNKFFSSTYGVDVPSTKDNTVEKRLVATETKEHTVEKLPVTTKENEKLTSELPPSDVTDKNDVTKEIIIHKTIKKPVTATKYYTYETVPASGGSQAISNSNGILDAFFGTNVETRKSVTYNQAGETENKRTNSFFDDIFNIPISTLRAVSGFLSNAVPSAHSGSVNVKKVVTVDQV